MSEKIAEIENVNMSEAIMNCFRQLIDRQENAVFFHWPIAGVGTFKIIIERETIQ